MTSKDFSDRFWELNNSENFGANTIALYFYLLKLYEKNKQNKFSLSDTELSKTIRISRKTIHDIRINLQEKGLIKIITKNGVPAIYTLINEAPGSDRKQKNQLTIKNDSIKKIIVKQPPVIDNVKINLQEFPTQDVFLDFVKQLPTYNIELEEIVLEKYNQWAKKGWKNNQNRPITDWKAAIKSTLPFLTSNRIDNKKIPQIKRPK